MSFAADWLLVYPTLDIARCRSIVFHAWNDIEAYAFTRYTNNQTTALEIDGHEIGRDNFVPPVDLRDRLFGASNGLHNTSGVCIIKGLNPALYSDSDNLLFFLGLANFIGDKHGIQDKKGNVICECRIWSLIQTAT